MVPTDSWNASCARNGGGVGPDCRVRKEAALLWTSTCLGLGRRRVRRLDYEKFVGALRSEHGFL